MGSLLGICVIVLTKLVINYICFKCFWKTTNEGEINEHQRVANYRSLSYDAVRCERRKQPGPQGQESTECTYLTPVFRDKTNTQYR